MIDISAAREGVNRRDITNVCLLRTEHNIADAMTKFSSNSALQSLLKSYLVDHPVEQYVVDPLPYEKYLSLSNTPCFHRSETIPNHSGLVPRRELLRWPCHKTIQHHPKSIFCQKRICSHHTRSSDITQEHSSLRSRAQTHLLPLEEQSPDDDLHVKPGRPRPVAANIRHPPPMTTAMHDFFGQENRSEGLGSRFGSCHRYASPPPPPQHLPYLYHGGTLGRASPLPQTTYH
jgi:hypothetical protein